jgi:hypothetical protein
LSEPAAGQRPCARGEWCSQRTVAIEAGERVITPAGAWRPYCDPCEAYLAQCARELPGYYLRLGAMIGDPLQARVQVHAPFGSQPVIREDVDAHMRLTAAILGGWESRVRVTARLWMPDPRGRHDTPAAILRAATTLSAQVSVLMAMQPGWMTRAFRFPFDDETSAWLADSEIVRAGEGYAVVMTQVDGEAAGREIQWLHYRSRSLLGETSPPPEILIPPCRKCARRLLLRAYPDAGRDRYSRCGWCGDEMTSAQFDVNALRWLAYHRGRERATLGEPAEAEVADAAVKALSWRTENCALNQETGGALFASSGGERPARRPAAPGRADHQGAGRAAVRRDAGGDHELAAPRLRAEE